MEWRLHARDAFGRPRDVVVTVAEGRVSVRFPPGEGLSLTPKESDWLALALQAASIKARGRLA